MTDFLQTLYKLRRSGFGLKMGKFRPELGPLIDVKNLFPLSILNFFDRFSSNFVKELILGRSGLGLKMSKFSSIKSRVIALD